ncbi:glycosyltransferase family 4 protein [Candidatus Parcubacteria bacterium]|nr:MAG: glycosyltransferase family 4 protein [Candidatus Parcubacteria bacterium]
MKVALIHDHLAQDGGAEKVLKVFADMYPKATIFTLLYEKKHVNKYFTNRKIETSIIQRLPGGVRFYQWYMPFMPMAVEFFDLDDFDLVISDASAFAKGVITPAETPHICYCHTPTRYLWDYTHKYINELSYNKYFKKVISLVLNYTRLWDRQAADRVDYFIANSNTVKRRIAKYYKRSSRVIYPPVENKLFDIAEKVGDYYLIGARLSPYKRFDVVIQAFKRTDLKLKIFGSGVDEKRLREIAGDATNIEFLGRVSDEEKAKLYSECRAFMNPQDEDFGITAIEAMVSGRPVIAYRKGGATETVIEGETGEFFDKQTEESVYNSIKDFDYKKYNTQKIRDHALKFSEDRFKKEIKDFVEEKINDFKK